MFPPCFGFLIQATEERGATSYVQRARAAITADDYRVQTRPTFPQPQGNSQLAADRRHELSHVLNGLVLIVAQSLLADDYLAAPSQ